MRVIYLTSYHAYEQHAPQNVHRVVCCFFCQPMRFIYPDSWALRNFYVRDNQNVIWFRLYVEHSIIESTIWTLTRWVWQYWLDVGMWIPGPREIFNNHFKSNMVMIWFYARTYSDVYDIWSVRLFYGLMHRNVLNKESKTIIWGFFIIASYVFVVKRLNWFPFYYHT